jgi:hypothetical protein
MTMSEVAARRSRGRAHAPLRAKPRRLPDSNVFETGNCKYRTFRMQTFAILFTHKCCRATGLCGQDWHDDDHPLESIPQFNALA